MGHYCYICEEKLSGGIVPKTCPLKIDDCFEKGSVPKLFKLMNLEDRLKFLDQVKEYQKELRPSLYDDIKDKFLDLTYEEKELLEHYKKYLETSKKGSSCIECYCPECWNGLFGLFGLSRPCCPKCKVPYNIKKYDPY
jgi:hypothetical protein